MHKVVLRDLKPENILVDKFGYLKLIDLSTAKLLVNNPSKTKTIIGTPHYMAPEMLTNKGYSFQVDIWAIGICLYEFICGMVPFGEQSNSPYDIFEEIIKKIEFLTLSGSIFQYGYI